MLCTKLDHWDLGIIFGYNRHYSSNEVLYESAQCVLLHFIREQIFPSLGLKILLFSILFCSILIYSTVNSRVIMLLLLLLFACECEWVYIECVVFACACVWLCAHVAWCVGVFRSTVGRSVCACVCVVVCTYPGRLTPGCLGALIEFFSHRSMWLVAPSALHHTPCSNALLGQNLSNPLTLGNHTTPHPHSKHVYSC